MAAELRAEFPGVDVQLVPSSGGRFEVVRDGKPVFQKSVVKRHAKPGEVVRLLKRPKLEIG